MNVRIYTRHNKFDPRPDPKRCRAQVSGRGGGFRGSQCSRKPAVFENIEGEREPVGFCKQHCTATRARKRRKRRAEASARNRRAAWNSRKHKLAHDAYESYLNNWSEKERAQLAIDIKAHEDSPDAPR